MKTFRILVAGMAAMLAAGAAAATTLEFSYTSNGGSNGSASWTQSSTPALEGYSSGGYTDVAVTSGMESHPGDSPDTFSDVYFENINYGPGGGFETDGSIGLTDYGVQLYSGDESAPTFSAGVYTLSDGSLTVTALGAPEPAAWSMMLLGISGLGGCLRAGRNRRLATA